MKNVLMLCALAMLAACGASSDRPASAPPAPAAAAPPACVPAPTTLVVREIQEGKGAPITTRTAVLMGYTGWLYDGCKADLKGTMFDSSSGRPTPFGVVVGAGRVIKGWDEGLVGMREGGKRLLIIPPDKGYGAAGAPGGAIPPNSTLVFEVDLMHVVQRPQP